MADVADNDRLINDLVEDQVVIGASDPHVNATIVSLCTDEGERAKSRNRGFDRGGYRRCCGWITLSDARENCGNVGASGARKSQFHAS
jgi:hypothetical protein